MNKITTITTALILGVSTISTAASAAAIGTYTRKTDQSILVHVENGLLYCTRVRDGFELCHGMSEQEDGTWKGKKMKHPDMPRFMTFNGTVTFADGEMSLKGCAFKDSMCDSETWPKQ